VGIQDMNNIHSEYAKFRNSGVIIERLEEEEEI